jgi:hypothetical protein
VQGRVQHGDRDVRGDPIEEVDGQLVGPVLERGVELATLDPPVGGIVVGRDLGQVVDRGGHRREPQGAEVLPGAEQRGRQDVGVGLDEAGQDRRPRAVDDGGLVARSRPHLALPADSQDAAVPDGHGLGLAEAVVDREDGRPPDDEGPRRGPGRAGGGRLFGGGAEGAEAGHERTGATAAAVRGEGPRADRMWGHGGQTY